MGVTLFNLNHTPHPTPHTPHSHTQPDTPDKNLPTPGIGGSAHRNAQFPTNFVEHVFACPADKKQHNS